MTRVPVSLVVAALAALMAPLLAAPKPSNTAARVTLADVEDFGGRGAMIRSDGGDYVDGEACVQSWFALPKGNFFLRTVNSRSTCPSPRRIVIDLSQRVWPSPPCSGPTGPGQLDVCGVNEVADVRLVADRLFSADATRLTVPFSLEPDFRATAFELDFVETLAVITESDTERTMTTAGTSAFADLWQISGRTKTLLGRYEMPLRATVLPKS